MSETTLSGYRVQVLVTNYGVEQDELIVPVERLRERGATVVVAAASTDPIQTLVGDKDPGRTVRPDTTFGEAGSDFDLLLIPGGTVNADSLRLESGAVDTVRAFASSGRPIAAICHGPWALVEAGVVDGRTVTSYPSLQTDLRNAGATWVDQSVSVDEGGGFTLVTSRNPGDLDDFVPAVEKALAASHDRVG
ncbi:type 1 glutamine amidotransferase domain-containing protein [uncultured Cellulomonas sp.]|uniref:type 1 glutamine amidotransferase domain-containing protein n=1 Tax=uncultured Cellulomonas sp. TaxID=189682 RepID=UPI0028EB87E5|nr:type 1 glutamine amidotransferase domain-containing protein [uncultured Cellulomonas sp.]